MQRRAVWLMLERPGGHGRGGSLREALAVSHRSLQHCDSILELCHAKRERGVLRVVAVAPMGQQCTAALVVGVAADQVSV